MISLRAWVTRGSYLLIGRVSTSGLMLLQDFMLANALGVAGYGVFGAIFAFTRLTSELLSFRTDEAFTHYLVKYVETGDQDRLGLLFHGAFWSEITTKLLAVSLSLLAAPWVANNVSGGEEASDVYALFALSIMFMSMDALWFAMVRAQKRFAMLAWLPLLFVFIRVVALASLWVTEALTLYNVALVFLLTTMVRWLYNAIHCWLIVTRHYRVRFFSNLLSSLLRIREISGFWRYMGVTYGSSVVSGITKNVDVLILGYFRSDEEVGLFNLAKKIASNIQMLAGIFSHVIYQDFNELLERKQIHGEYKSLLKVWRWWAVFVVVYCVVAWVAYPYVIEWFFQEAFLASEVSFQILLIGMAVSMSLFWAQPMVMAMGLTNQAFKITVINGVISVALSFALAPLLGQVGVAIGLSVAWAVGFIALATVAMRNLREDSPTRNP